MADENTPNGEQDSTPNPTPWQDDLEAQFSDPTVRSQVDDFLRGKVQPYVTQLEQSSAPNRDAERLWQDFSTKPTETFGAVAVEIFGQEEADKMFAALRESDATPDSGAGADPDNPEFAVDEQALPANVREAVEYVNSQRQEEQFKTALDQVKADNPDVNIVEELFYPFISAAEGDWDIAVQTYKTWADKAQDAFGGADIPDEINLDNTPPPTLSPETGTTAPPQQEKYENLDDAMDAWFAETKGAPPTV